MTFSSLIREESINKDCCCCCVFQVGVKHLVVYINKADAVDDAEVLELVSFISHFDK